MPLYDALATDKTDDTTSDDDHPDHHNDLAAALNLLRTAVGEGRNVASGIPGLDADGKLATSTIPAVALVSVTEVASQAAMLALTAQAGDVAVRSDQAKTYMLGGSGDPAVLANWIWLQTPSDVVLSVNGQAGVVNLAAADVGAQPASANLTALAAVAATAYGRSLLALADQAALRTVVGTRVMVGGNGGSNAAATRHVGLYSGVAAGAGAAAATANQVTFPGTLSKVRAKVSAAPGLAASGKAWTITVYKNGVATTMTGTILETATEATLTTNPVTFADGDSLSVEFAAVNTPTTATMLWSGTYDYT